MNEALKKAQAKYQEKCKIVMVRIRKDNDADILAWMGKQKSVGGAIKTLIRQDIERGAL